MKKTRIAKMLTAAALSAAMVMTMGGMTAFAEGNGGVTVDGSKVSFNKTLTTTDTAAQIPAATFSFTVEAAPSGLLPADGTIKAGVGAPAGSVTATFAVGAQSNVTTVDIPFTMSAFTQPGVYRYLIKESSGVTGSKVGNDITNDTAVERILDVQVKKGSNGLTIDKAGMAVVTKDGIEYDLGDIAKEKSSGYNNTYDTYKLVLSKELAGDMADDNDSFSFSIEMTGPEGSVFNVALEDSGVNNASYTGYNDETTTMTLNGTPEDGMVTSTFSGIVLGDGDSITISGIPSCVSYKIVETEAKGYTASYTINGVSQTVTELEDEKVGMNETKTYDKEYTENDEKVNTVKFTNTREADDIPMTGIILNFAPYALLVAFAGVFAVLFLRKRREEF